MTTLGALLARARAMRRPPYVAIGLGTHPKLRDESFSKCFSSAIWTNNHRSDSQTNESSILQTSHVLQPAGASH